MPALDIYHDHVRDALDRDGWHITHDPLHLQWGVKDMSVGLLVFDPERRVVVQWIR